MGPALQRWMKQLLDFQLRRGAGKVAEPWVEFNALASSVDGLALEGLDSRAAAGSFIDLERAALLYEQRDFSEALKAARACTPSMPLSGVMAELFHANRELILGDVYLVRDGNAGSAIPHFRAAIAASGPATVFVAGNAAINLGICQTLLGQAEEAVDSFELALKKYQEAGRPDKIGVAFHTLGNAYRSLGRNNDAANAIIKSVEIHGKHRDSMGVWAAADDLSRVLLNLSDERPTEREQWIEKASSFSDIATAAANEVWKTLRTEEGRLADLSDQMINHTITRCDIAATQNDFPGFLGSLALMKGRIRLSRSGISAEFMASLDSDLKEGIEAGVPWAYFQAIAETLERLANGRPIALIDQLAVCGNQVMMGYAIISKSEKILGGWQSGLPDSSGYDPTKDLRGRDRGSELLDECLLLLNTLSKHSNRCAMVLPPDIEAISDTNQSSLSAWAKELEPSLARLGEAFFPSHIVDEFRARAVEHVVLCIDPLFPRVPYSALIGKNGPILDEPWSLSFVTASTELIRISEKVSKLQNNHQPLHWFGPDKDVNENRGGDLELRRLLALAAVEVHQEDTATVEALIHALSSGRWCHFRGHGEWTGSVDTSGPVLANDKVLTSDEYSKIAGTPGYLFTAACVTHFGEAVGSEGFGSLVDYDRVGLLGAVLTNWPIHGDAAAVFSSYFYEALRESGDVAAAMKKASGRTRSLLPHPYLWAPFAALGSWMVGSVITWTNGGN